MSKFRPLISAEDVAEMLGKEIRFVYRLTHERRIRFYKIGKELRFRPEDVEAFVESHLVEVGQLSEPAPAPRRGHRRRAL